MHFCRRCDRMPIWYQLTAMSFRKGWTSSFTSSSEQNRLPTGCKLSIPLANVFDIHARLSVHFRQLAMNFNRFITLWIQKLNNCAMFTLGGSVQQELHFQGLPSQDWASQRSRTCLFGRKDQPPQWGQQPYKQFLYVPTALETWLWDSPRTSEKLKPKKIFHFCLKKQKELLVSSSLDWLL